MNCNGANNSFAFTNPSHLFLRQRISTINVQRRGRTQWKLYPRIPRPVCFDPCSIQMSTKQERSKIIRSGTEAAVEDFVKSGMNICIGGGNEELLTSLINALSARVSVEGLIDIAFVSTSENVRTMLKERDMPNDLSVNFKKNIDLYIAPVTCMDNECNAVLDTNNVADDRFAAEIADNIVIIILEDDFNEYKLGLKSIPVQLIDFLPENGIDMLRKKYLRQIGIIDVILRKDSSHIADIYLAENHIPKLIEEELVRLPCIKAVGILPAGPKTMAVIASNNLEPIDISSSLTSLATISKESRSTILQGEKKNSMISSYVEDWQIISGKVEALLNLFTFPTADLATAFVRYIHFISRSIQHHPEIKQSYNRVQVCLTTYEAEGITEFDVLFARELSACYTKLSIPIAKSVH